MNSRWRRSLLAALAALLFLAPACSRDSRGGSDAVETSAQLSGSITVFAAASLKDAFGELALAFKTANAGTGVIFNFAGSPTLRTQLEQGARADIYASADLIQMKLALDNGAVRDGQEVFARNSLVVITPKDNPGKIAAPKDLARPGLKIVLANQEVPVGAYSRQALMKMEEDAGYGVGFSNAVLKNVVSSESNVKQVVAKVELGEADAGIVYGTDVTPSLADKLVKIEIPTQFNVVAEYPIALTNDPGNIAVAEAFIDFVMSPPGQAILKELGFLAAE